MVWSRKEVRFSAPSASIAFRNCRARRAPGKIIIPLLIGRRKRRHSGCFVYRHSLGSPVGWFGGGVSSRSIQRCHSHVEKLSCAGWRRYWPFVPWQRQPPICYHLILRSAKEHFPLLGRFWCNQKRKPVLRHWRASQYGTVSYTHLTLPTNYSVY